MQLTVIVAIIIAIAGVAFAMQNGVPVTVVFFLWRFDGSLAMVLLIAMALGGIVIALVSTPSTVRRQWTINRQRKRIDELEQLSREQKDAITRQQRGEPEPEAAARTQPYVGLKQLVAGGAGGDKAESGGSS